MDYPGEMLYLHEKIFKCKIQLYKNEPENEILILKFTLYSCMLEDSYYSNAFCRFLV